MSQLNDISLVAQVVVFRNTRAFDRLVGKYQSSVRRFFLHLTRGDSELSDDLAQDTFIKAYTNLASFKNLSSFSTWLYRIAYNVFYDYLRTRKETDSLETLRVDAQYSTQQRNGTDLYHSFLYGRPKYREDCRHYRLPDRNSKKPPVAGQRKNGYLLKTKWL